MRPCYNFIVLALVCCFVTASQANNIQISNATLDNSDNTFYYIEFDVSWENSWRTSTFESNWDAAWVVVKFTPKNEQSWSNVDLYYSSGDASTDGHTVPAGGELQVTSDGVGAFIYRSSDGIGDVNFQTVRLKWEYGTQGLFFGQAVDIGVFATEMVYIPQGGFYLGDGDPNYGRFEAGTSGNPYELASEAAITLGGGSSGSLGNSNASGMLNADDFDDMSSQLLPAAFPKGYDAFYIMKYEMSQQQYADFLATLTNAQREDRDGPFMVNAVNVFPVLSGDHWAVADFPWRPMSYLAWGDAAAWADWAGLRPMSELEYEKACRGALNPIPGEYAWGNTSWYYDQYYTYQNEDTADEIIVDGIGENAGNANPVSVYWGDPDPVRCGIFAASATNKTRQETGATYWGVMEMTGNMYETVISVGNSQSRDFSGLHGDGNVTSTGNASFTLLTDWAFVGASGIGFRDTQVSSRYLGNYYDAINRQEYQGFRGVRSAE